jgi:hypothetical protein
MFFCNLHEQPWHPGSAENIWSTWTCRVAGRKELQTVAGRSSGAAGRSSDDDERSSAKGRRRWAEQRRSWRARLLSWMSGRGRPAGARDPARASSGACPASSGARAQRAPAWALCRARPWFQSWDHGGRRNITGRGFLQMFCLMGQAAGGPSNSGQREYKNSSRQIGYTHTQPTNRKKCYANTTAVPTHAHPQRRKR